MGSENAATTRGSRAARYFRNAAAIAIATATGAFAWRFSFPDAARAERPTLVLIAALVLAGAVITQQFVARHREQHLRSDVEARLETEQEMSRAKDRFLAEISSELRTPLTSIHTFSEYLLDHGLRSADETREVVGMINRDSSGLSHTIEDLLVAARLATSTLQVETAPVDLVAIATEEAHRFRRDDTSIQVHGEPTYGWADRTLVRHVIRNLVTNAIRHGEGKIDIVVTTAGSASSVTVSDNGTGFANCPALAVQTDASGSRRSDSLLTSSTRLGLDVARSLTEAMGGTLRHERRLGWTQLIVMLPKAPSDLLAEILAARREEDESLPATLKPAHRELVTVADRFADSLVTFEQK